MQKTEVLNQLILEISSNDEDASIYTESLQGFKTPQSINSFIPDIEVFSKNTHNLIEVQVSDDFNINRWKSFSDYSRKDTSKEFHIIVPKGLKDNVKDVIVNNDIDAQLLYF